MTQKLLTEKQLQVLRYLACGLARKEICAHMHCGPSVISRHLVLVRLHLRARTNIHAICIAMRKGLIT